MLAQSRALASLQVQQRIIAQVLLATLFAVLIWQGANIRVEIGLVPFTAQLLFVVLAGLVLGPKLGAAAVAEYVAAGLAGLPVFARGGGPAYLLQPTMGYLVGFIAAAWVAGFVFQHLASANKLRAFLGALVAGLAGAVVIHLIGMPWVAAWAAVNPASKVLGEDGGTILAYAWAYGTWPFLVWDSLKALVAAAAAGGGRAIAAQFLSQGS